MKKERLITVIFVQMFFASCAYAQVEHWFSELKVDRQSFRRLLDVTDVTKLNKRIDAVHEPSGYTWINTAWATMLMKKGIVPEENVHEVAGALLKFWNSPAGKKYPDGRGFQRYFTNKLGARVAGNMTIGRTLPTGKMEIPVRHELLKQMCLPAWFAADPA